MKLGIVIGHNSRAQGANGVAPISASEYVFNGELADIMDDAASDYGMDAKIFRRRAQGSVGREIREVYRKTDRWGADFTIELHFNAFNGRAAGTETLTGPSAASMRAALEVQEKLVDLYDRSGRTDRGVKRTRPGQNGRLSLVSGAAPAILVEPFFGDNPAEARLANQKGMEALAEAYLSGIAEAFDLAANRNEAMDDADEAHGELNFDHWR